jgi:hypothetical protein
LQALTAEKCMPGLTQNDGLTRNDGLSCSALFEIHKIAPRSPLRRVLSPGPAIQKRRARPKSPALDVVQAVEQALRRLEQAETSDPSTSTSTATLSREQSMSDIWADMLPAGSQQQVHTAPFIRNLSVPAMFRKACSCARISRLLLSYLFRADNR